MQFRAAPTHIFRRFLRSFSVEITRYKILFFGTDNISVSTLRKLHENSQQQEHSLVENIQIVCPSDRKIGRKMTKNPVPVKRYAMDHGLSFTETPSHLKSLKYWTHPNKSPFDVGVVVSFGYFLYPHLLDDLKHGAINMHPSLLPKYRGPAPIHHALLNGDRTTGVSIIEIDPLAFDTGRILLQKPFPIPENITFQPLATSLSEFGASCVLETLRSLPHLREHATVQNNSQASKAPKVRFEHGFLTFKESAIEIFQKWQTLGDSVGLSVQFKGKRVKLCKTAIPSQELMATVDQKRYQGLSPGTFFFDTQMKALWLRCAQDSWLTIFSLQQEDRKIGEALDFVNGYRLRHKTGTFEPIDSISK